MNCPRCGLMKFGETVNTPRKLIIECLDALTRNKPKFYCTCEADQSPPKFWSGNKLTEEKARQMGPLTLKTWQTHRLPEMRDCRDLDYEYFVDEENQKVICKAIEDYFDITEEVEETFQQPEGGL